MFLGILFIIECIYFVFILNDKKDYCLDNNICEEGLEINTEHGLLKINKENCENTVINGIQKRKCAILI